jgi:hypothetical protein
VIVRGLTVGYRPTRETKDRPAVAPRMASPAERVGRR